MYSTSMLRVDVTVSVNCVQELQVKTVNDSTLYLSTSHITPPVCCQLSSVVVRRY